MSIEILFNKFSYVLLNYIPFLKKIVIRVVKKHRIVKHYHELNYNIFSKIILRLFWGYYAEIANKDIFHCDLYRLDNQNDFDMLGIEITENSNGIFFIEWPNKVSRFNFGEEFFLKLSLINQTRYVEFETKNKKFLNCIDGININNPI